MFGERKAIFKIGEKIFFKAVLWERSDDQFKMKFNWNVCGLKEWKIEDRFKLKYIVLSLWESLEVFTELSKFCFWSNSIKGNNYEVKNLFGIWYLAIFMICLFEVNSQQLKISNFGPYIWFFKNLNKTKNKV